MRAGHGRGSRPHWWGAKWRREATGSRRGAGVAGAGYRRAGGLCGSNRARAPARDPRAADAAAHLPGVALRSRFHSIDTARAGDTSDSGECWRHRPRAGCHRPRDAAPEPEATARPGSGAFRRAGEESLDQQSARFSRRRPWLAGRTLMRERMRRRSLRQAPGEGVKYFV